MRLDPAHGERGSIPLVLLAAIVLGGLIIALYLDVSTGLRLSAADRDFNQAIQVADAGMQDAFSVLARIDETAVGFPAIGQELPTPGVGSPGRGTYTWTARRVGENSWHVRSVGEFGVHERVLEATIGPLQLFALAAFGDVLIELRGGNNADSYPDGGQGNVGSNHAVVLRGNAEVDWIMRYGRATYNDGGIIRSGGGIETGPYQNIPDIGGAAYAPGGLCYGDDVTLYSDVSDIVSIERGQDYCVSQARFQPGYHPVGGTSTEPARIFIAPSGNLELLGQGAGSPCTGPNGTACVNVTATDTKPDSTALEIYLAGGGGEVLANNNTRIAAAIYAPLSACSGPNAQGYVFGSILCRTLDSKGGWEFHYDERLDEVNVTDFAIQGIREELGDGTSFAVVD